jgi:AhpC/TSA family
MRNLWLGILLCVPAGGFARAGDGPAPKAGSYPALKAEYDESYKAWLAQYRKEYEAAKKAGKVKDFKSSVERPGPAFSPRFLAIAEAAPDDPEAVDALQMALTTGSGPEGKPLETRRTALRILRERYAAKPEIRKIIQMVATYDDQEAGALTREIIARNPDRDVQAKVYRSLIGYREMMVKSVKSWKDDPARRKQIEEGSGKQRIDEMIARADRYEKELDGLRSTLREKYGDLVLDLSIGKPAPEVVSQDLDGRTVRLSDYRGKVVVLDVWATWCGPCRAMIPHEREMVERLKSRPFQLVSISADEKKETLREFLEKEKMPWAHWWVGVQSRFGDDWDIR